MIILLSPLNGYTVPICTQLYISQSEPQVLEKICRAAELGKGF